MDPSSGSPRPAIQPQPAEDSPIATDVPLARFEFSDAGTKVLMVEWYPGAAAVVEPSETDAAVSSGVAGSSTDAAPATTSADDVSAPDPDTESSGHTDAGSGKNRAVADASGSRLSGSPGSNWEVSWPGKTHVLHATESDPDPTDKHPTRRRVFFLLPPDASIPANIALTPPAGDPRPSLNLKPLPAIFPPGFDAEAGTRGVLHTIWARRRLAALDREMAEEMRTNAESVGLQMVYAEKEWIQHMFLRTPQSSGHYGPLSTRNIVSSRLGDKLRGLKLATSPADLTPGSSANTFTLAGSQSNSLSPQGDDIAVSSFSAMTSKAPANPISLNAALHGNITMATSAPVRMDSQDDDLFALPLSPRSPDMKKSPFSAL